MLTRYRELDPGEFFVIGVDTAAGGSDCHCFHLAVAPADQPHSAGGAVAARPCADLGARFHLRHDARLLVRHARAGSASGFSLRPSAAAPD